MNEDKNAKVVDPKAPHGRCPPLTAGPCEGGLKDAESLRTEREIRDDVRASKDTKSDEGLHRHRLRDGADQHGAQAPEPRGQMPPVAWAHVHLARVSDRQGCP